MIIRQFNIISQYGPNLEIIEQREPDQVAICIGNEHCILDRKAWEELHQLSKSFTGYGDYVKFVEPTKEPKSDSIPEIEAS